MMMKTKIRQIMTGLTSFIMSCWLPMHQAVATETLSQEQAYEISMEAYIYLYPLITMDVTRRVLTNVPAGVKDGMGPMNTFQHLKTFPSVSFREVVRPNFDTLYSIAWVDLSKEPMIVSSPDTQGRYFLLPMLDMWTDVFAVPGKRTNGTKAANYLLTPYGWKGAVPENVERIEAPTPYVWIIGRTQTNSPEDYDAVHKIQANFKITPLSNWGKGVSTVKFIQDPSIDMKTEPLVQVNTMPAFKYFTYGAELMKLHPPHLTDWSQIARLKKIGIEPGKSFDFSKADPIVQAAMEKAVVDGLSRMKDFAPKMAGVTNGWQMNTDNMGVYGNSYLRRAVVALMGLGANQPADAVYPINLADSEGNPLVGGNKYVIQGEKGKFCPVHAFCSLTMYDEEGFQVPNPINRFAIGDRDKLRLNADGSISIYIQHQSPGTDKESNWLPSPAKGKLGVTMRLYAPKPEVLEGKWSPPVIRRVE